MTTLLQQLQLFKSLAFQVTQHYPTESPCEYSLIVHPRTPDGDLSTAFAKHAPQKSIALTLGGMIHGNEVFGLAVCHRLLSLIAQGLWKIKIPVCFFLGNEKAALENKRFLEKDLNRSFGKSTQAYAEEKRAKQLEIILEKTAWFIDFHQTNQPSLTPFFIFPYQKTSLNFAQFLSSLPIVTHWGTGGFSTEGMCSDEFVNSQGGIGITVEAGQAGFDPLQIGLGIDIALQAYQGILQEITQKGGPISVPQKPWNPLYTWSEIVPYPRNTPVRLLEGWKNFSPVNAGDCVGFQGEEAIRANASGWILFPKYVDEKEKLVTLPRELFRIVKKISLSDLP